MEKPKNYQPGGQEALNEFGKSNFLQMIFIILLLVWAVSAIWVSIKDIFNGFQHPVLTTTFISGSLIGIYLRVRQSIKLNKIFPNVKMEKKGCTKCGKNKSK